MIGNVQLRAVEYQGDTEAACTCCCPVLVRKQQRRVALGVRDVEGVLEPGIAHLHPQNRERGCATEKERARQTDRVRHSERQSE